MVAKADKEMSAFGRFCGRSLLRAALKRDSVVLTRIAARSIHDGRLKSDQGQLFYEFRPGDAVPEYIWCG